MRRLGELEAEIMDRLWSWGRPATVRELVDDLNRARPLAYTTVMTVADVLHGKGMVRREKDGRAWLYEPTRTRESYTAALMQDALAATTDRSGALAHFVGQITPDEQDALRRALRSLTGDDQE
ncbi:BlaI/MecI/CopY family transcriptional regulator [Kitasatospora sp. NPDC057512]|uniref:BlaI/MecI/CopY family transcriptional regulator n=1 Tax=Kitasatospora sp. NPDC057512 TaxID=3346154 RepID=UPI0036902BF9